MKIAEPYRSIFAISIGFFVFLIALACGTYLQFRLQHTIAALLSIAIPFSLLHLLERK